MLRMLMLGSLLMALNLSMCNRAARNSTADDRPDWENISQFQSVSRAGQDSVWVVTASGQLVYVSTRDNKTLESPGEVEVVHFLNQNEGWAVDRKSAVWQTSDAGNSWRVISAAPGEQRRFYLPRQLIFLDRLNGWLLGIFQLWGTNDGGKTWHERFSVSQTSEERVGRLYRGAFLDANRAWLASSGGVVIRTGDGGETWQTFMPVSGGTDLHDITVINEKQGWLVGKPKGGVYSTETGGTTWREQLKSPEHTYLNSVTFVSDNEGWAVGHRYVGGDVGREGVVLHSVDGGRRWTTQAVGTKERFFDRVVFSDRLRGWLVARDSIYYTNDAGKTWVVVLTLPPLGRSTNPTA